MTSIDPLCNSGFLHSLNWFAQVKLDALKPWIHEKLTEILGFEDDVVIDYAINQLEETNTPDPKNVQINLTGFLNAKVFPLKVSSDDFFLFH